MKTPFIFLSFFFYLLYIPTGSAQDISFGHLTTDDGLSHNTITAMYQDERGYLWIGTRNGFNLYNGQKFKIYKHEKDNFNSLPHNAVYSICGNQRGEVYVATKKGICIFNIEQNAFTTISFNNISQIYYHQGLYAVSKHSILKLTGKELKPIFKFQDPNTYISNFCMQNDSILIGTNKGLYILENKEGKLSHLIADEEVCSIFKDKAGRYWVSTNNGLLILENQQFTHHRSVTKDPTTLNSNNVRICCQDKAGNIWVGTSNGLNKYNPDNQTFTRIKQQGLKSLSHSSIWHLFCDNQGTIWIGSFYGGINYFNPEKQIYREYQVSNNENEGLSCQIIGEMAEDNHNNIWICTDGGGINKYDRTSKTFTWYKHSDSTNSLSHNNVKSIYYDKKQEVLWTGTHTGGLNKLDVKNNRFTHYLHVNNDPTSIPSNIIRKIIPYHKQLILITNQGICKFNPQTGKCEQLLQGDEKQPSIESALGGVIDHNGILWLTGTNLETCSYRFDTKEITTYRHDKSSNQSISHDYINQIFEDSQNRLWFCTSGEGLDLYHRETNTFENFDMKKNGLASNTVYNICELSPDKLLLTTDNGFSILDCKTKMFRNYNTDNGIPLSTINENSLYRTHDGEIFIGGTNGMFSFFEKSLNHTSRSYRINPDRLLVNGKEVEVGDQTGILQKTLSGTSKITLTSKQSFFTIEYALTDYIPFSKDNIIYRLEGFSNTWTSTRRQNSITYTNLNPGKYTLVVRTEKNDTQLVPESRLEIEILPPFYKTIWAYIFYFIITAIIVYYLIYTYHKRITLQESLKYEQRHNEDIEKLNQAKFRFFTNISHEFRTPLTIISGQVEMLLQIHSALPPAVHNKIAKIHQSCLLLRDLVTELLDFRKQEQGFMTIKVSEHNIVDFIQKQYSLFQEYASLRGVHFKFLKTNNDIQVWYDAKQMQKVMNNLISNAFKHTKQGGSISLSIRKGNQEAIIEITDNGPGIPQKDIDKIFERFYQTNQSDTLAYTGTGIGLALTKGLIELHQGTIEVYSNLGEGTTFCIHLKTGNAHFKPEEIAPQTEREISPEESTEYPDLQQTTAEQENTIASIATPTKNNNTILIVEDNESLRDMLVDVFEAFYTVYTASNGKEALEIVRTQLPDMVLSDIIMPEMSGIELCKIIKQDIDICHIPIVLLTAKTAIEHAIEGLQNGADDYITKPFNINILISRCNNLINNRIILQEKFSKQPQTKVQILANNALDKKFIDKANEIIDAHIDDPTFNVDVFANEMCIARTKLFNKLKAITGQTPYEFILTIRLKKAAIILKNELDVPISGVSDRLGFSSPKQFSKSFKEKYHVVPQVYRKTEDTETED